MDPELQRPLLKRRGQAPGHEGTLSGQSQADLVSRLVQDYSLQPPPRCLQCLETSGYLLQIALGILRILAPIVIWSFTALYYLYKIIPKQELLVIYGWRWRLCLAILLIRLTRFANQAGVVLKAVDPDTVVKACAGLYQGFLGLLVSLKFKFAWTVALACSIADLLRKPVALVVTPIMVALMPKGYHKWINQIINLTLKAIAVHMAWKLQEVISAVQSGLLGASLVGTGVLTLTYQGFSWVSGGRCCKRKFDPDKSYLDELVGLPLAAFGIWFQLKHNFSLPFPYNLALLPLTIVETAFSSASFPSSQAMHLPTAEVLRFMITWFPVEETAFPAH
eukprot:g12739.t1